MMNGLTTATVLLLGMVVIYANRGYLKGVLSDETDDNSKDSHHGHSRTETLLNRSKRTHRIMMICLKEGNIFKAKQAECILRGLNHQLANLQNPQLFKYN